MIKNNSNNEHIIVMTGGQFANDAIDHIRNLGRPGWNIKVIIFTKSIEMNMPYMSKEPGIVKFVGYQIQQLMQGINDYLKYAKTNYR